MQARPVNNGDIRDALEDKDIALEDHEMKELKKYIREITSKKKGGESFSSIIKETLYPETPEEEDEAEEESESREEVEESENLQKAKEDISQKNFNDPQTVRKVIEGYALSEEEETSFKQFVKELVSQERENKSGDIDKALEDLKVVFIENPRISKMEIEDLAEQHGVSFDELYSLLKEKRQEWMEIRDNMPPV